MSHIFELIERLAYEHRLEHFQYVQLLRSLDAVDTPRLFSLARETVCGVYGKSIFLRGLIEVTNFCANDCLYCGIRRSNYSAKRYRLDKNQILERCAAGYALGLRTFVLQGGEDPALTDECICSIVSGIKRSCPGAAVTLSLGEKTYESYKAYRNSGADRYLLRHETAAPAHYALLHPAEMTLKSRMKCLSDLKTLGFQVGAGFMVGSPGQTPESLADDLVFLQEFRPHMAGIGPFIPHCDTPFAKEPAGSIELTLILLALVRLILPEALLPATTALGTLDANGYERGILSGANVVMPNLTPQAEREKYKLYNGKSISPENSLPAIIGRISAIGYSASGGRGDHISMCNGCK